MALTPAEIDAMIEKITSEQSLGVLNPSVSESRYDMSTGTLINVPQNMPNSMLNPEARFQSGTPSTDIFGDSDAVNESDFRRITGIGGRRCEKKSFFRSV